ncbi:MAG: hypothetical protein PHC29_02775 [Candidatus Omnitrophica bacterium]|nr:hypothetical protein [Candidatus Omnitrophota bacterium]
MDKQTSDERLLKLIEGNGGPKDKQVITPKIKKASGNLISGKLDFLWLKSKVKDLKVNLLYLNKGLIGLGILLTLIFLYTIFSAPMAPKSNADFISRADVSTVIKSISTGEGQELIRKDILNQTIKRDFFIPFDSKSANYPQDEGPDLTEEFKTLKLVGIIWSQNPEIMVEDSKDSRTYTLKKGEFFNDQFKVKEISRNSATLEVNTDSGSREYELR